MGICIFKDISHQSLDKRKRREIETEDWQEYDAACVIRLDHQVPKYAGFTPAGRVFFWRAPELPLRPTGGPNFKDFTNPGDTSSAIARGSCEIAGNPNGLFRNRILGVI